MNSTDRTDVFTPAKRSAIMAVVRNKDTGPELQVRRLLHGLGYRYRLHRRDLPGRPDIVLPKYHKVIFVHGCFWHRHADCPRSRLPKTRRDWWRAKLEKNAQRDETVVATLKCRGWGALVIWQCEISDQEELERKLTEFLHNGGEGG